MLRGEHCLLPTLAQFAMRRPQTPQRVCKIQGSPPLSHTDVRTEVTLSSKQLEMELVKELKSQL